MKFSSVLSILLAGLAVASPLVQPQGSSDLRSRDVEIEHHLVTRVDDTVSEEYKKVHGVKSDVQDGKFYAFNIKWPNNDGTEIDKETPQEIQELQKQLGYKHIGVIVGKVKDVEVGKGKNKHKEQDFTGQLYHLIKNKDGSAELEVKNYKLSGQTAKLFKNGQLSFLKEVSSKSAGDAKKTADNYFKEDKHKKYSVKDNNCASFATAFAGGLK